MIDDEWTTDGARITDADVLERLRPIADDESPIIIEHRFYRGARAPHRCVVDSFEQLETYLRERTRPGDSIYMWRYDELCRDDNALAAGKVPDAEGRTPRRGSY